MLKFRGKGQIPRFGSKFRGQWKTVGLDISLESGRF